MLFIKATYSGLTKATLLPGPPKVNWSVEVKEHNNTQNVMSVPIGQLPF